MINTSAVKAAGARARAVGSLLWSMYHDDYIHKLKHMSL